MQTCEQSFPLRSQHNVYLEFIMAKGSQLTQLRSELSGAGVSGTSNKKKKRSHARGDEKERARRAERLREIQRKLNPFDVKVTKLKHDTALTGLCVQANHTLPLFSSFSV